MFRPILFLANIRFDTIIGENCTIYNMIQYNHKSLKYVAINRGLRKYFA